MDINFYELIEDWGSDEDGPCELSLGCFSTYEKAAELMKEFDGLDGFGICEEELKIVERTIKLDVIDELVIDIINTGRQQKKEYEEGH